MVRRASVSEWDPSEWSVDPWDMKKGVGDAGGVLEAHTLGPFGVLFSSVSLPTFSAAHANLEYSENYARDGGPPSHCICVVTGSTDFGQP